MIQTVIDRVRQDPKCGHRVVKEDQDFLCASEIPSTETLWAPNSAPESFLPKEFSFFFHKQTTGGPAPERRHQSSKSCILQAL